LLLLFISIAVNQWKNHYHKKKNASFSKSRVFQNLVIVTMCLFCNMPAQMLHDPFICGILPAVLKWTLKNNYPLDGFDALVEKVERQCGEVDKEYYEDYCLFWVHDYDANIRRVLSGTSSPIFLPFFTTYVTLMRIK